MDPTRPLTRRQMMRLWGATIGASSAAHLLNSSASTADDAPSKAAPKAPRPEKPPRPVHESGGGCITDSSEFYNVERGNPLPYKLPPEKRREIGMERETWRLEVIADPQSDARITQPMLKADGSALTFDALMKLAEKKAVSYLKVISCNNLADPLGQGLWEGVPLREILWLAGPVENLRHVYYYGHHNEDPKQIFKCYLPMNRVFEDPPGDPPVMLCYKLNGKFLTGERGGPVRMIVPEAYGFKSVKWLQRIVFTNAHQPDDTYASGNNDINSWLKTLARFGSLPDQIPARQPLPIGGHAQVGISGLAKVQFALTPAGQPHAKDDRYLTQAPWQDAKIIPCDARAIADLATSQLDASQFDPATGQPRYWPLRYTLCRWSAELPPLAPGDYELRCRSIDLAGHAQPLPRPFPKSGKNQIQKRDLKVVG